MNIDIIQRFLKRDKCQVIPIDEYILWSYLKPGFYDILLREGFVWDVVVPSFTTSSVRYVVKGHDVLPYPIYNVEYLLDTISDTAPEIRELYPQWFIREILLYKLQE